MNLFSRTCISILVIVFFSVELCYGQTYSERQETAVKLLQKGEKYGSQGKFKEGKELFERALELGIYSNSEEHLEIIDYIEHQKIKPSLAIHYFKAIRESFSQGIKEAISQYCNEVVDLHPEDPNTYFIRGHIYEYLFKYAWDSLKLEYYDNAISDYSKAIELNPKFFDAYLKRGYLYSDRIGNLDKAIPDYNKAIELNPNYAYAYKRLSSAYRKKGQYDKVVSNLSKAIALDPENPEYYFDRGESYRGKNEYDNAITDYSKAIELKTDYYFAYSNRSNLYFLKGEYSNAISDLSKQLELIEEDANTDPIMLYLDIANVESENIDKIISDWKKAKNIVLSNANEYFARGVKYFYLDQYNYALSDFNKSIDLNPENPKYYKSRGNVYAYYLGEYEKAILDYNMIINMKHNDPEAYVNRGAFYHMLGIIKDLNWYEFSKILYYNSIGGDFWRRHVISKLKWYEFRKIMKGVYLPWRLEEKNWLKKAITDYSMAIELNPNNYNYRRRGETYADMNKFKESVADYTKAIELADYSPHYNYAERGDVYFKMKDYDKAVADYSKAIDLITPMTRSYEKEYHEKRVKVYTAIHRNKAAIADYSKIIEISVSDGQPYINRGDFYEEIGNLKNACSDWKKAFDLGVRKRWSIVNRIRCLGK